MATQLFDLFLVPCAANGAFEEGSDVQLLITGLSQETANAAKQTAIASHVGTGDRYDSVYDVLYTREGTYQICIEENEDSQV